MSGKRKETLAIVGIGCRFPGGVYDPESFWKLLIEGRSGITEVPEGRWNVDRYYDPNPQIPGKMVTRWGGFVDEIDKFDARFFGITPREALRMDPQQRWLLEVTWEALEDGGLAPDRMSGTNTGVFVGIASNDYANIQMKGPADVDVHTNSGSTLSIASNRISFLYNFKGPSLSVDTACSSALVAINLACRSIWDGQCDSALAGGVNALLTPDASIGFSKASMLSPDGQCYAFDARANGYVRGEGAGILVITPLKKAQEEGLPIYALIRAAVVNQDGRTNAMTVPGVKSQSDMLEEAYRQAGITPKRVRYMEAHGTGTPVGDPIELQALGNILCRGRGKGEECVIGSVKTNIGHLESGSGVAGLIKAALVLKHRTIPPNLNFETPNPNIRFDELRLRVPTEAEPLPCDGESVVVAVNSFGFGGTNAHIVLEEAPPQKKKIEPKRKKRSSEGPVLLPVSANTEESLKAYVSAFRDMLENGSQNGRVSLPDLASTAALRKSHHEHRLAVVGVTSKELAEKLQAWEREESRVPGLVSDRAAAKEPTAIFVFSGQGPQWWGMGQELLRTEPVFRKAIKQIDKLVYALGGWSLLEEMSRGKVDSNINRTYVAQPAIFAVQVGLAELWRSRGVEPVRVVGHSVGEVAAAYWAGIYSLEDAVKVIFHRSRLQEKTSGAGRMAAVGLTQEKAKEAIRGFENQVAIAAINGPAMVTLAGDTEVIETVIEPLEEQKVFVRWLQIDYAFHTHQMNPIKDELLESLADIEPKPGDVPFISTVAGDKLGGEKLDASYWWKNVREPVRFSDAVYNIIEGGDELFLELGPSPIHSASINECLTQAGKTGTTLGSLRRRQPEQSYMLETLGRLYAMGYPIKWEALQDADSRFVRLPSYPWKHESFWLESEESKAQRLSPIVHPLLGVRVSSPSPSWEFELDPRAFSYLDDHRFWDSMIFPASGFAEIGFAVARELFPDEHYVVEDIKTTKALFYSDRNVPTLRVLFDEADGSFRIYSSTLSRTDWDLNAHGRLQILTPRERDTVDLAAIRDSLEEKLDHDQYYFDYEDAGYQFGPNFQLLQNIWVKPGETIGEIVASEEVLEGFEEYHFHPAVLDACFQCVKGAQVAPEGRLAKDNFYLPATIKRVRLYGPIERRLWGHADLYLDDGEVMEANVEVFNDRGERVADILGFRVERVEQSDTKFEGDIFRCFYQLEWKEKHLRGSGASGSAKFAGTEVILRELEPHVGEVYKRYDLERYFNEFMFTLEDICVLFIINAFCELGWRPTPGERFRFSDFVGELGIVDQHERLTRSFLVALDKEDVLKTVADEEWEVLKAPKPAEALPLIDELEEKYPNFASDLHLERVCGARLGDILSGKVDPMEVIFPGGSVERFSDFYKEGADFLAYNELIQIAILRAIEDLPQRRTLRVLEVGAGTGSLTRSVLPILPKDRSEYSFTDIGPLFLNDARKEFSEYDFVEYRLLDVEKDPVEQGMKLHSFDLILATDVLHATSELRKTLGVVRDLLASNGLLIFLEVTSPRLGLDMVFGQLKGWWQYSDTDLRSHSALLPREKWEKLLNESGFENVASFVDGPREEETSQTVFLAKGPELDRKAVEPRKEGEINELYLVIADHKGTGRAVAERLREEKRSCLVVEVGDEFARLDEWNFEFQPESHEDIAKLIEAVGELPLTFRGIVHCLSVDHCNSADTDPVSLDEAQKTGVLNTLLLAKALGSAALDPAPRVWMVTRGAQYLNGDETLQSIASTPLSGFLRVANNEYKEFCWTVIDLDPEAEVEEVGGLFEEIILNDGEFELALRSGKRFVHRVLSVPHEDLPLRLHNAVNGKAVTPYRLKIPTPGILDNLSLNETTRRSPEEGEVEIRVAAGGINFRDVMKALGIYPGNSKDLRWLGDDFSGTILRLGEGVEDLKVGDEVVGMAAYCFRSHVTIDRNMIFRKPGHMSFEEAATLPTVYLTAYYALNHLGHLQKGEKILIHAGSGGVGQAAIRIAQGIGAEIFTTAGTPEKRKFLRDMGVSHVMDSRSLDFADEVMRITEGGGVDMVLNSLRGDFIRKSLSVLAPYGRFLEIGKVDIYQNTKIGLEPFRNNISYFAIDLAQHVEEKPHYIASLLKELSAEFSENRLPPLPLKSFPITEAGKAFRYMAQAKHIGKNVLSFQLDTIPVGPLSDSKRLFKKDASYLITGGASGFGLEVAKWMARLGAGTLVLGSRSGAKTEGEKRDIEEMIAGGVAVIDARGDFTKEEDVTRIVEQIKSSLPPLKGVIHGAMVLDDDFIKDLDRERFNRVLRPKMLGAWNLHLKTKDMPLDHFVCLSSISSMIGATRQSNYCAGNLFLDALAHYRRSLGLPALTLNWGAILGAGFVERDEMTAQYLDKVGMKTFQVEEALEVFADILGRDPVQLGAARIDWKLLFKINPTTAKSPTFSLVAQKEAADSASGKAGSIRPMIIGAPPEERLKLLEDFICEEVAQVFGTSSTKVERETPLTQIGLDSLMAIELMNRLESSLGINLQMGQFLQGPNISQLTVSVLEMLLQSGEGDLGEIAEDGAVGSALMISDPAIKEFPLSRGQRALWFLNRLAPESSAYNLVFSFRISPYVDIPVMKKAFAALFRRHPMLDVTIKAENGQPIQVTHEGRSIDFREHDATELNRDEIKELLIEHTNRPFDLERGPVVRLELFRTADNAHVALLCMHHIVSDAWSVVLIMNDLIESYFSIKAGFEPEFAPLNCRYADYVKWQQDLLDGPESEGMLKYWVNQMSDAQLVLDLPTDHPRPPIQSFNGATHGFKLKENLTEKVEGLASERNVTLYTLLLSAFQVLLHRYCNQDDLLVGSPFYGRQRKEFHDLVGYFINPVVLRSKVDDDPVFTDYLDRVSDTRIGAFENQEYPLSMLVDHLQVRRDSSRSPIFQVTFSMERIPGVDDQGIAVFLIGQGGHNFKVRNISVESIDLNLRQAQFEISLVVEEADGNIYGCWQYNRDLFEPETIARLNMLYEQVLEDLVVHPGKRISEISFLSQEEERKILEEWNATASDCTEETCVHQLVSEHAARTPEAVAVTCAGKSLTYLELNRRANGVAEKLRTAGIGLDMPVGILVDRSLDMLVGILGILKSGGCFVPLDPAFPSFRLEQMLDDAKPGVVLTQNRLLRNLPKGNWTTVLVESCGESAVAPVVSGQTSESLAYIIYTSGSTGRPKGVEIPHRAVVNFLTSMRELPGLSADDTLLAVTTLSFDISILELLLPLISEARVVIATRQEASDGRRLSVLLDEYVVTTMQATPATWQMLLDSGWEGKHDLRAFCGGETLSRELAEALLPSTRAVWNLYGPTETTIWSTVDRVTTGGGTVSIGRPIANTTVYILDDNHKALPPGFTGNFYIGGDGLARGYHNQPEMTAEKFLQITLPNGRSERLYETGDMARFRPDGKIDFLGRNDSQIKLRGYRIELEDIEEHLKSHPYVKQAIVIKRNDLPSEGLAAYIIPEDEYDGIVGVLRSYMMERMPEYMRPGTYELLDEYPMTPNRKVDWRKLPAPTLQRSDIQAEYLSPRTPSEKILVDILNIVFKSDRIGIRDNFFDLGGDSLLAVQILTEVSQAFNRRLPLDVFLQNPTVENLARYLDTVPCVQEGQADGMLESGQAAKGFVNEELDSSYLTVEIIDNVSGNQEDLPRADAVALAYIPDAFLALTGLSKEDIVHNWLRGQPFLSNLYETSFGRIGLIMLPRLGAELYKDQDALVEHVVGAMEVAAKMGAAQVSLTGLIPSATDYGRKIAEWIDKRDNMPEITTGHATTTATIIKSIEGLLSQTERDFSKERVAIVGLGSIGYASLRLMLEVLPHPRELILCDLYQKAEALDEIRRKLAEKVNFQGDVRLETSRGKLPDAVYEATFILGATNVPGILDVNRLQPGSLIVDDSFPPCFRVFDAIKRLETQHDILFTTGGLLRLNEEISETIFLPNGTASLLEELGGDHLLTLAGRDSREITGCILSSLLTGKSSGIRPTLGPVKVRDSLAHYRLLQSLEFEAARPQCENYFISPEMVARFKEAEYSGAAHASNV